MIWGFFIKKKKNPSTGLGMRISQSKMLVVGNVSDCLCVLGAQSLPELPFGGKWAMLLYLSFKARIKQYNVLNFPSECK